MGKFDGILLATDFDGTLYYNSEITEENLSAIEYFTSNGGKFTVCSGRYYKFLQGYSEQLNINTYMICYNGAYILDVKSGEVLHKGFCDGYLFDLIDLLIGSDLKYENVSFYTDDSDEPIMIDIKDYPERKNEFINNRIYKVLFRALTPEDAISGAEMIDPVLGEYIAVRSWDISLELMKRENAKGQAIRRVGEKLGARLIVAVGDYENDIEMIKDADIGYAVENSCDKLKAVADIITCHAKDSAIAKIISELEKYL